MNNEVIVEGPSIAEALDSALEELGVQQDSVEFEVVTNTIVQASQRGITRDSTVRLRVWLKENFIAELKAARADGYSNTDVAPADVASRAASFDMELSEEEIDKVADSAAKHLRAILDGFGMDAEIEEYEGDEGEIILDVVGTDLGICIGRHGKTLDAIQVLVGAATGRALGLRYPVIVDVEGYRNRLRGRIEELAFRSAKRVVKSRQAIRLRPMSSYERRVVHFALRNESGVSTGSEGEEPFRSVVISPK